MSALPDMEATSQATRLEGIPTASHGYVITKMALQANKPIIHICANDRELDTCQQLCNLLAPELQILTLPAWDCLPYDRVSPSKAITAQRIATLCNLSQISDEAPFIVLTTIGAAMQKLAPASFLRDSSYLLKVGKDLQQDDIVSYLVSNGYTRTSKVMEPGEFAIRGSIIDIFPPNQEDAIRLDLFGDEIESIKLFDSLTQVSHDKTDQVILLPTSEIRLDEAGIEQFRMGYREQFGAVTKEDPLYESISEGRHYAGAEHWLPLFYDRLDSIFEYVPNAIISHDISIDQIRHDREELLTDYFDARTSQAKAKDSIYHPVKPEALYLTDKIWATHTHAHPRLELNAFLSSEAKRSLHIKPSPDFSPKPNEEHHNHLHNLKSAISARENPVVVAAQSIGSRDRIQEMLHTIEIPTQTIDQVGDITKLSAGIAHICVSPVETGFDAPEFLLLSEQDIFGERIIRTQKKKKKSEAFMAEASAFEVGEYVVHKEHGIARFDGLITMEVNGAKHDCLTLIYAGEDKLFLPVENIDMISRYGSSHDGVTLDKLGSTAWQKRKAGLKKRIKMAAEELLKIAAKRATKTADQLHAPTDQYHDFCARFPYQPTEDQQQAIDDVIEDLGSGQPMDRLICGDVGFGKTEVALRAAFVATASDANVQVAVIAPTTLLARQHYYNFKERFEGLPVEIRLLSRLVTSKEANDTREKLEQGKIDIVIGTHALLSKQVKFGNLGLVIVDEEQHFGVKQKEKLKRLRANTHVLTLSATPIPRTLHMALSGVRELSLITTPPIDRLAVRSFVMPLDEVVIREAILREYHRGGKTFYVTPRIKYIDELKAMLDELVPDIKICIAHGQMTPTELDRKMNEFYDGKYDLLLSTAIIESGLDVPSANTMIIDHAELFGLAQLYQLRGRVGRGKTRAYAYFTLPPRKTLTNEAVKRLEVMQTLDTLGAGFALASHDMDIRGFGNLLGEEQSGHVKEVGIELYQSMLEEMIDQLKSGIVDPDDEGVEDEWSPQINLGTSALIPESYVEDLSLRLSLYRRLAKLNDHSEIDSFAAELIDRFGPLPDEMKELLNILRIKQLCKQAGVERIDTGPKGAVFTFRNNSFAKPEALLAHITQNPKAFKLRHDQKLVLMGHWRSPQERFQQVSQSVETMAQLAA
ncbi:MAG: transcription-repair coupling factor [Rickettsiales bacterium]|nr:transcription-repair coupling factor [Rickettsiales bacterium]